MYIYGIKKERADILLEEAGKYSLDISKLVFGGVVLAGIMNLDVNTWILFNIGTIVLTLTAMAGFLMLYLSKIKRED
ncbi:MAG: DUF6722 family protein [Odoribacter sp.]